NKNKLNITYQNKENARYTKLPIPYEKGWELKINGKKQPVEQADYSFIGFRAQKGENRIELAYYPPYFKPAAAVTLVSLAIACFYIRKRKKPGSK
ncbi:YfhO family protein, partial [Bacillus atrophaeus]